MKMLEFKEIFKESGKYIMYKTDRTHTHRIFVIDTEGVNPCLSIQIVAPTSGILSNHSYLYLNDLGRKYIKL